MSLDLGVGLPEDLLDLGRAVGIVLPGEGPAGLREEWFEDPGRYLGGVFVDRGQREALLRLAARRLGDPADALDLPDLPDGQQWIPLGSGAPLYLVVTDEPDGAVLGLGLRAPAAPDALLSVTAHIPVLRTGGAAPGFVLGTATGAVSVAVSVRPGIGVSSGGVSLDAAALAFSVPTDGSAPTFVLELEGLRTGPGSAPRSVRVDSSRPAEDVLDVALSALAGLVEDRAPDGPLAALLALMGLGDSVSVPALPLASLLREGSAAVRGWLRGLISDAAGVRGWAAHLAELLGLDPSVAVTGVGSATDPFAIALPVRSATVAVTLELGRSASTGDPVLRPGLRVRAPAPDGFPGRAEAALVLAEITAGSPIRARPLPSGGALVHLGRDLPLAPGVQPLVASTLPDGTAVSIAALDAGLALDDGRPVLLLAALDVAVGADSHPRVDLTMPDAVREVVVGALDGIVGALLSTLGGAADAEALLALLGLRRPGGLGPGAAWPHDVSLAEFFTDPLGAVAGFHTAVLAAGDWGALAAELGTLLSGGARPAVPGGGTGDDPWTVLLAQGPAGTAELTAHRSGTGTLALGLRLRPAPLRPGGPLELATAVDVELLQLDPAARGATAVPGLSVAVTVGRDLAIDLGPLVLGLQALTAGVHWRRGGRPSLRIAVQEAVADVDGERVPLPIPAYDSVTGPPALPVDFPWVVVVRLFADALLSRGVDWLAGLATLAGWDGHPPDGISTFPPGTPADELPSLPVERLPGDPAGVLREWVAGLLGDVEGTAVLRLTAWIGALTAGTAPGGGPFGVDVSGGGTSEDPYAVGIGTGAGAAELLVWFEPEGSTLLGVEDLVLPPELTRPLDLLEGDLPTPALLARLLGEAARSVPELAPVVDGRPRLGEGLTALLTRLADSDGLVPLAAQHSPGTPGQPALEHPVLELTHLEAPLGFEPAVHLPPGTDPTAVLYVSEAVPGLADWPHRGAAPVLDLTEPGLPPEAFALPGPPGAGPWFARLGSRAAAGGIEGQAGRLARVVAALDTGLPGGTTLTVVAHGPAGLAAHRLAADPASTIGHLVTLAAPLAGVTTGFLDEPGTGDAIRALQALAPMLSDAARDNPFTADGLAIVDLLGVLLDGRDGALAPVADYRLEGPPQPLPDDVGSTTILVGLGAGTVSRGIASIVRHAIADGLARLRADRRPPDAIGIGARVRLGTDGPAPGRLAAQAAVRVDLHRFRLRESAAEVPLPRIRGSVVFRRSDGWLSGGPRPDHDPGVARDPRLRRADLAVSAEPGPGGLQMRAGLTLYEASALGIASAVRRIELTDGGGLDEVTRVLLDRLADALGEADAGPTAAAVTDVLRALGVLDTAGFVIDGVEQLLVDPAALTRPRLTDPVLLAALRALTGSAPAIGDDVTVSAGGLQVGLRLGQALVLRTAAGGIRLAGGPVLSGEIVLPWATGPLATVRLGPAGPGGPGAPALVLSVDPARPEPLGLVLQALDVPVALMPFPDTQALTDLLVRLVPAELLRLGLSFAAQAAPAVVEPLLTGLGLRLPGDPAGHLRHPLALLVDPAAWLGQQSVLGGGAGAVAVLVDGLRTLLGVDGAAGTLPLPWGLSASVAPDPGGDGVVLRLGGDQPQISGSVTVQTAVEVLFPGSGEPRATLAVSAQVSAAGGTGVLEAAVGAAPRLALRITPGGAAEIVLPLVPPGGPGGLAGAAAGVARLLPLVLDALADAGPPFDAVGPAVAALGDALALRTGGSFDGDALAALAADPAGALAGRLRSAGGPGLSALAQLVAPALPAGALTVDVPGRRVTTAFPGSPLAISLQVPGVGAAALCAVVTGFEPVAGLRVDGTVCVAPQGLRRLDLRIEATDPALLAVDGLAFFPFAAVLLGPDAPPGGDRFEIGSWLAPSGSVDRRALVLRLPVDGSADVVCRPEAAPDDADVRPCAAVAARRYVLPLLVDLVTGLDPVATALDRAVLALGGTSIGALLDGVLLARPQPTGPYSLDPAALEPAALLDRLLQLGLRLAQRVGSALVLPVLQPLAVELVVDSAGTTERAGVRLTAPPGPGLTLVDTGDLGIAVEADTSWFRTPPRPADGGVTLLLVTRDGSGFRLDPELRVEGLGVRISAPATGRLIDLGVTIRSLALHGVLTRSGSGAGAVSRLGVHLELDGLTVPLGSAASDNPVAGKILSSGSDSSSAGDPTPLAPAFSPAVVAWREDGDVSLLVRAGTGSGPWWLPVQRSFGPVYVEQVGVGAVGSAAETSAVQLLLDGGLQMLGLSVGVDDLGVTIPVDTPLQPGTWKLGLAGLALGLDAGGLTVAGGLRERRRPTPEGAQPLPPDYVGMLRVSFAQYGITAIGGYGEFPDGTGDTYTSFFLFGALSAPLGGPPAFFVTGIGAGGGINRRLVVPPDLTQLPSFPLIAAMDPDSDLATDPMGALDRLGEVFPAERGTFWFAAGIRFTSFVVVESIAVLSAEIGDGLEVNLLGLSRMDLPTPQTPMARIELALRARFSTREGVLSVQGQLTDNSWIINESCRLTGGFAFVTWFRTGQFVLTLGGYHPRFARPAEFPVVPRLGYAWQVSDMISIKGDSYFALTASCVMAGARLDVSIDAGWLWGRLVAGFDALIAFDPFSYRLTVYAAVTVGFTIEICVRFLGCARIRFSMTLDAELDIEGPELRGTAKLDLDVTSFTVRFGATGAQPSRTPLRWTEFYDKYLVAGDEDRRVLDATVTAGGLALPAGGQAEDGSVAAPWRVLPEFVLTTSTRAACTEVNGARAAGAAGLPLGVGPMQVARISSEHTVALRGPDGTDATAAVRVVAVLGFAPAGIWETVDGPEPPPEAKVRPAAVGATVTAVAGTVGGAVPLPVDDVDPPGPRHPLPFHAERAERPQLEEAVQEAAAFAAAQPTGTPEILASAASFLAAGVFQPTLLSAVERRAFAADRVSAPRLAPLTEGIVDPVKPAAQVRDRGPIPPGPAPDTTVHRPVLDAQLRLVPPGGSVARVGTTVSRDRLGARRVVRRPAPSLVDVADAVGRTPVAARLVLRPAPAVATRRTVIAAGGTPPTRFAGGLAERRRGLLAAPAEADALDGATAGLTRGVPVRPGDVQVWRLPNSAADLPTGPAAARRPGIAVRGDQDTRVVVLDRGGAALSDVTGTRVEVLLPVGAHRIVVAGLGRSEEGTASFPIGLPGWHAGSLLAQVSVGSFLAPSAVVTANGHAPVRRQRAVGAALVRAGEAVLGSGAVLTRLPAGLTAVLVALDTDGGVDVDLAGLVLGVEGATRVGEPLVVTASERTYAVFGLRPGRQAVTVTVASDERWQLAAVVGSTATPAEFAARVTHAGVADLVADLVTGPLGASEVRWIGGPDPHRPMTEQR